MQTSCTKWWLTLRNNVACRQSWQLRTNKQRNWSHQRNESTSQLRREASNCQTIFHQKAPLKPVLLMSSLSLQSSKRDSTLTWSSLMPTLMSNYSRSRWRLWSKLPWKMQIKKSFWSMKIHSKSTRTGILSSMRPWRRRSSRAWSLSLMTEVLIFLTSARGNW